MEAYRALRPGFEAPDFAEWERETITERTRTGRSGRARSGRLLIGCRPLYGYRLTDDGRYEVHLAEMENVRLILRLAADGEPLRAIRSTLEAAGVPSPTGRQGALASSHRKACRPAGGLPPALSCRT